MESFGGVLLSIGYCTVALDLDPLILTTGGYFWGVLPSSCSSAVVLIKHSSVLNKRAVFIAA